MVFRPVVTFDLFSALVDSRSAGSAGFGRLAAERGWDITGRELYDRWDARNKQAQRDCRHWRSYAVLARGALADTYRDLGLRADAAADADAVLATVPDWPLWPDVVEGLARLRRTYRVGVLSNVDDGLFLRTRAAALVDPDLAMTSERLQAYKPGPLIYHRAQEALGPLVHVASSARDVRGAREAEIPVVRVRRPGHDLDPDGPRPTHETDGLAGLGDVLGKMVKDGRRRRSD